MITETPKLENLSLYEMIMITGGNGFDCCDIDWDFGVFMTCEKTFEDCHDYYDKFMLLLCLNVQCEKYKAQWYSPCDFVSFFEENKKAINKFLNEENREGYRPKDYKHLDKNEDSGYYEVYFLSFENLINGNYCESDYEKLYKYLGGK